MYQRGAAVSAKQLFLNRELYRSVQQVQNRDLSIAVIREFHALRERERAEVLAKGSAPASSFSALLHSG